MMYQLSIIIGFKNREIIRIKRCLDSLNNQTNKNFQVLFIDYGSDELISNQADEIVNSYSFCKYIFNNTRGRYWNRSHALNTGIKIAKSKYTMTTDIDMIFSENFIETIINEVEENKILYTQCYWLPQFFDYKKTNYGNKYELSSNTSGYGGCQIVESKDIKQVCGFDENFMIWGIEDEDLNVRFKRIGLKEKWLAIEKAQIYHQWHPVVSHKNNKITPNGWYELMRNYYKNKDFDKTNNDWGFLYSDEERPILNFINNNNIKNFNISFPKSNSFNEFVVLFNMLNKNECIKIAYEEPHKPSGKTTIGMKIIQNINSLFEKFNINQRIINHTINNPNYIKTSEVRDFLFYFILNNKNEIEDYYINYKEYSIEVFILKK